MSYLVFDLETSIYETHKRKANPFDAKNDVVARGWKKQGDPQNSWEYFPEYNKTSYLRIPDDCTLLVGFNIKFDLLHEMAHKNPDLAAFFKRGGKIWCGQYVEYLLGGMTQDVQMVSMDQIIESYGGRKKIDEVKAFWEAGIQTREIPEDLLIDYLVGTPEENRNSGDIGNTELIFLGQVKRAVAQGQIKMIQDRMDGLLATTMMEFNGIKVDVQEAKRRLSILRTDLDTATTDLEQYTKDLPWEFNWGSRTQTSCLIFGGTVKYQVREGYNDEDGQPARLKATERRPLFKDKPVPLGHPQLIEQDGMYYVKLTDDRIIEQDQFRSGKKMGQGKFRNVDVPGELKIKWQDRFYKFTGYTKPLDEWKNKDTDGIGGPTYSTSGDVIELISNLDIPFLKSLGKKQSLDKEIGTYYFRIDPKKGPVGMLTCVQPWDHMLHPSLNHTSTVTSRLSSNNPNLQNIPRNDEDDDGVQKSEVKAMFVSRFGADGVMGEADYSQLEVVVQGVLSGDENLCQDLRDKIDFHCKRVAMQYNITYDEAKFRCKNEDYEDHALWRKRRTVAKVFSFQRAYGAGAAKIAIYTGMDKAVIEVMIKNEELMYPGVVLFNAQVESEVMKSAQAFQARAEDGSFDEHGKERWKTYRMGQWKAPTGTIYKFRSYDAPEWARKRGILDSFMPTELKNYPIQGTGGEFVQAVLGLLFRRFIETDNYGGRAFLINTVHDCVWVDMHKDVMHEVCRDLKRIMESIPEFYNNRYNMNITVPFPVEVEVGPTMINLKHWHDGEPAWHHANDNADKHKEAA